MNQQTKRPDDATRPNKAAVDKKNLRIGDDATANNKNPNEGAKAPEFKGGRKNDPVR